MNHCSARFWVSILAVCILLSASIGVWIYLKNYFQNSSSNAFHPFIGRWFGHARELIFYPDGHTTYTGRVFRWCDVNPAPCDAMEGDGGLKEILQFSHGGNTVMYGTIVSGTDDYGPAFDTDGRYNPQGKLLLKVGSSISLVLKPEDKLAISDGWVLCGPQTPRADPACSSA